MKVTQISFARICVVMAIDGQPGKIHGGDRIWGGV